ncbi:MAG: DUF1361 domain-containing protein [Anaerolineae bacterium]|jgi:uncharacterized membrane protein
MERLTSDWRRAHDYCAQRALYALVFATGLALFLLASRIVHTWSGSHLGLAWNLVLAWVPYAASLRAESLYRRWPRRPWRLLLPGALWLAFLPNGPYLITDLWYLHGGLSGPLWFDIGLLALLALTGLTLGTLSLRVMQRLVAAYLGRLVSWLFVLVSVGLSGLGVYLGRFLRWNSWDLFLRPGDVLADIAAPLASPADHVHAFAFVALYAAIILFAYLTLTSGERC